MSMVEEWRVCPNFPMYKVSNFGEVARALPGEVPKMIKPFYSHGYARVGVGLWEYDAVSGVYRKRQTVKKGVHTLVAEAFYPEGAANMSLTDVAHLDGDKNNNRLDNLQWMTHADNNRQRRDHGTLPEGESHYLTKMGVAECLEVFRLLDSGMNMTQVGVRFGVSKQCIRHIVRLDRASAKIASEIYLKQSDDPYLGVGMFDAST